MDWLTDEILFYGGIAVTVCSMIIAILCFCVFKIKMLQLNYQLNEEYGPKEKK